MVKEKEFKKFLIYNLNEKIIFKTCQRIFNIDKNNKLKNCSITKKGIEQSKKY